MQTICNLRVRGKTWYGGVGLAWPSRLIESAEGVGSRFSSWGDKLGLELTEYAVTVGSFRESSNLMPDIVYEEFIIEEEGIGLRSHNLRTKLI